MRVADYKELRVYKLAFESAMEIFEASREWPPEEKFSLADQIESHEKVLGQIVKMASQPEKWLIKPRSDADA